MTDKTITMPVTKFVKEHKNLLDVLRHGTKEEQLDEATDQAEELKQYTGGARAFPEQYSKCLQKVLNSISLGEPQVLGSSADHEIMYSADFDLLEYIPFRKGSPKQFQNLVAKLKSVITDIKCGEIPEWNLLTKKSYNQASELAHLRNLWQNKIITDTELKHGESLLKPRLTVPEKVAARKDLRFGLLRWTPAEVAKGSKEFRNKTIYLDEAMKSSGVTKIDILAWCHDKYIEVSNIFVWTHKGGKPFLKVPYLIGSLKDDVAYYISEGNYFKALKRMYSIAKNKKEQHIMKTLQDVLNSPLGHAYVVVSDLKVLKEFPEVVTSKRKRTQLDKMRNDMAKLYFPEFDNAKNVEKLLPALERTLQDETKKKMEELQLLPIKNLFKPGK